MNRFTPCYSVSVINFEQLNIYMAIAMMMKIFIALTSQRLENVNVIFLKWGLRVMDQGLRAEENQESFFFFFLSEFSFTDTDISQNSRAREGTFVYSTLPLLPAHEHSDLFLQLCM